MRRILSAALIAGVILVGVGCVIRTEHKIDAHVRLDVRYIAEQANDVLDYIEGASDKLPEIAATPAPEATSWLQHAVDFVAPVRVAYAQDISKSSPLIREILDKLKQRHSQIDGLKRQGCLGETNRGYVALRPCTALDAQQTNDAQKLLAEENEDRKALYRETARLNEGATVGQIEDVYAMQRLDRGRSGEIFELPPAGPNFDKFKASAKGQALGSQAQPGAWVTLP